MTTKEAQLRNKLLEIGKKVYPLTIEVVEKEIGKVVDPPQLYFPRLDEEDWKEIFRRDWLKPRAALVKQNGKFIIAIDIWWATEAIEKDGLKEVTEYIFGSCLHELIHHAKPEWGEVEVYSAKSYLYKKYRPLLWNPSHKVEEVEVEDEFEKLKYTVKELEQKIKKLEQEIERLSKVAQTSLEFICHKCARLQECNSIIRKAEEKAHKIMKEAFESLGVKGYGFRSIVSKCKRFVERR